MTANDGRRIGEDTDHVAASLDLAVELFERVGAVDLGAVLGGEVHLGQDVGLGVVHQCGQLGHTQTQLIGHLATAVCRGVVPSERDADPGGGAATGSVQHPTSESITRHSSSALDQRRRQHGTVLDRLNSTEPAPSA